jgi:hypothetical protein
MKKIYSVIILLISGSLLMGMGSLQGPASPDKIPVTAKKYNATFIDQSDVLTECRDVSIEGATFLEGKRGEGNYTISFDNIDHVSFRRQSDSLLGIVKMLDGSISELFLAKSQKAYGRTTFGTFQIRLGDLKKLVLEISPQR